MAKGIKKKQLSNKGVWLTSTKARAACGWSADLWAQHQIQLQSRIQKQNIEYFISEDRMKPEFKKFYSDKIIEFDEADVAKPVIQDVDVQQQLKRARIKNVKTRTKALQQSLEARKEQLWREWNGLVFQAFTQAFSKVKIDLVQLQLDKKRVQILAKKIDGALRSLKDRLDTMREDFTREEPDEEEE